MGSQDVPRYGCQGPPLTEGALSVLLSHLTKQLPLFLLLHLRNLKWLIREDTRVGTGGDWSSEGLSPGGGGTKPVNAPLHQGPYAPYVLSASGILNALGPWFSAAFL